MIPDNLINVVQCSLSIDKHIVKNPKSIQCGHSACKSCIYKSTNKIVKCIKCGQYSEINLDCLGDAFQVKCTLKAYIDDMFKILRDQMNVSLKLLKSSGFN